MANLWLDLKGPILADTVYVDGVLAAKDVTIALPPVNLVTAAMGTYTAPLPGQIEAMEASITKIGIDLGLRSLVKLTSKTIEIRWAQDVKLSDGSTKTEGCKAFLRCVSKGIPGLSVDPGNASENEIALAVSRYQLFVAGNEYWLIDQLNTIMRVGGVDYAKDIRSRFPDKVREEAKKLENAEVTEADCEGRMDLRALPIFTIDSAETKDIDDAISLTKTPEGGFELGVHIADVSHYVKPGSELDNEAFSRATSVYYADQVVPMLPKQLSNGICSLNEGVLRLAFSCLMRLDKDGNLTDYRFVKSVIRSRVKGVYSEINALLAGNADDELTGKYHEVLAQLPAMKELYGHRARLRKERGCMDIESGEVKLILDEDGHCIDVKKRTSGESEAMIEEFMLLANQCAAHFARVKQIPFVYRVHEEPNAEKLERLHGLLQACGVNDHFAKDVPTPKELSAILEGVRGTAYEQIINTGMLRCMSKAVYEEKPKGHYGLVLQDYAHFTSPIRRYPDLAIHRIMTAQLKGTDKDTMILRYSEFAEDVSKQASEREVIAMQIERKAEDCYKAEYARRHLGECYEGRISGVTQRGLFIELENGVEGFVPASSLTATGTMLTEGVRLSDPVSGKNWNLGDTMMITIVRADVNLGKIDFEVAPESAKQ